MFLYEAKNCNGFVKRDGVYWWIEGGALTSMDPKLGARIDRMVQTQRLKKFIPNVVECIDFIVQHAKYLSVSVMYSLAKKIERMKAL